MANSGFFDGGTEYGQEDFNRYFDNLFYSGVSIGDSGNMTMGVTAAPARSTWHRDMRSCGAFTVACRAPGPLRWHRTATMTGSTGWWYMSICLQARQSYWSLRGRPEALRYLRSSRGMIASMRSLWRRSESRRREESQSPMSVPIRASAGQSGPRT